MEFSNLLENPMVALELYGGHVGWILMTCLVATVVAICLFCLVKGFQNRQTEEGGSLPQSCQVDVSRVEDISLVEDVSPQQDDQESLTCPICRSDSCDDDHESTFLFHREQYKDHSNEEHIKLTQGRGEDNPLTIFEEIGEFKRLKTVTIIGVRIGYPSLLNLLQCSSVRSLKLVSCQIACVPRCLAKLKDLEILDLSHNNLTTLPGRSLHSLPCLKSLNLSHNNITTIGNTVRKLRAVQNFDVSFNEITEIPYEVLEMQNLKNFSCSHNKIKRWLDPTCGNMQENTAPLKLLNMSNNSLEEVPRYVKDLKNLSVVNISDNKIWRADVSDEIQSHQLAELFYMPSVSKLVLGNNNIKTLSSLDMARVSPNIELIDLRNNEIREVPAALLSMTNLKVLLLCNNKITKLPTDLDLNKLSPTLCVIDLSNNELDDVPLALCFLPSLEKLDLKQNKINTLSENVKSCKSLAFLDVSGNKLKDIPSHVTDLPKLLEIHASYNQINSVSSLKDNPSVIEVIALAKNGLTHFPEALTQGKKLKKVDLSNNQIKVIPQSIMDMPKDVKLNLQGNPIIDPPLQVCQAGLQAIQAFYEDLTTASSITQCLKTLFLGTYEAGKTSLVRVFKLNRSKLTKSEERTHGIEIAEINLQIPNTPDTIALSVWDFAGQETYYITHQFFLSAKALMLLVVNLDEYNSARFTAACGDWMENMIAKVGNPVVIPVATHIDKLSTGEIKRRCEDLAKRLEDQERRRVKDLERQLQRIDESLLVVESSLQSKGAVNDRKKQIEVLLQKRPSIHPNPIPVSSAEALDGIQYLKQVILNYAVNKDFFPEVGRPIPKAWADTEACVERKGEQLSFPYMTWDEFTSLLKENVPNLQPESRIKTVAQYLHDTGKILWYSGIESLRNHVFLKPASLVDIFRKVIRHDLETFIHYESDPCREADISPAEFQMMKNDLVRKGILHIKLLRCLWSDIGKDCQSGTFEAIFHVLIELMRQFDLCYDLNGEQHVFYTPCPRHATSSKWLLPWHIQEDLEDKTERYWESGGRSVISLQYQFPSFIPPGLFARLTVRAHRPEHKLHFVSHWKNGTLCKHELRNVLVLLKNEGPESLVVSLSARAESDKLLGHGRMFLLLWNTLMNLSSEMEDLLQQWPGVRFDRFTACPKCHQPSFPGEWLHRTSQFLRISEKVICSSCNERVNLHCLVPPPISMRGRDIEMDVEWELQERMEFEWELQEKRMQEFEEAVHCVQEWEWGGLDDDSYELDVSLVSDRQLVSIANKLGAEWQSLAIHMGFTQAEVYRFKLDNAHSTLNQIVAMLSEWKERRGRNATRKRLKRALRNAGVDYDAISCLDKTEKIDWSVEAYDDDDLLIYL